MLLVGVKVNIAVLEEVTLICKKGNNNGALCGIQTGSKEFGIAGDLFLYYRMVQRGYFLVIDVKLHNWKEKGECGYEV